MSTVSVEVNGHAFAVGCEDGQEGHVKALASQFDRQVQEVARAVGRVGDLRLFLMAALMTADELADVRARLAQAQAELARLQSDQARAEARAAQALDAAATRIEALAAKAG
jgi:cell division protein ZapA